MTVEYNDLQDVVRLDHDGAVIEELKTNAQAWQWIDDHGSNAMEIKRDRIANAFRSW